MPPQLGKVIEKVLEAGSMTQTDLAVILYGSPKSQSKISVMKAAAEKSGWEKHWQVLSKLVPLAVDLRVLTAHDLLDLNAYGRKIYHDRVKAGRIKTSS